MKKINVYNTSQGEVGVIVDDQLISQMSFGELVKSLDDTPENRQLYGLTDDNEPKVVNVLKSSQ